MRLTRRAFLSAGMIAVSLFSEQYAMGQAARMFGNATYVMEHQYTSQPAPRALQDIYDTPIPTQIREEFNHTVLVDCEACSECAFTVLEGKRPISIFTKRFMVVDLETDGVGGVSATLVFEHTSHPFLLRMDEIGGGRYALRHMAELPEPVGEEMIHQLQSPQYRRYWL
jgi:hypothetical protein